MRLGTRWLEHQRFRTASEDENLEELALHLYGADDVLARKQTDRKLTVIRDAGGEVA